MDPAKVREKDGERALGLFMPFIINTEKEKGSRTREKSDEGDRNENFLAPRLCLFIFLFL